MLVGIIKSIEGINKIRMTSGGRRDLPPACLIASPGIDLSLPSALLVLRPLNLE